MSINFGGECSIQLS